MTTKTDLWQYAIVKRADHDDLTTTIPCAECGRPCGGHDRDVPLHWGVARYECGEPKLICETCATAAGAEFIWKLAKAVDDVDFVFYDVDTSENLNRIADMLDHCIGQVTESWRRMAANGL